MLFKQKNRNCNLSDGQLPCSTVFSKIFWMKTDHAEVDFVGVMT